MGIARHCSKMLLFPALLTMYGCGNRAASHTSIPSTASITPTVEASVSGICNWPPVQVSGEPVNSFYWSVDGANLIYSEKDGDVEFHSYNLSSGEISEYIPEVEATTMPETFGVQEYSDFFISPDGRLMIYTQSNGDEYAVYLKAIDEKEDTFLGNIKGYVDKSTWLDNGKRLLLSIDWLSPLGAPEAYVYLVDVLEKVLGVIIPHTSEYQDITYFGLTPNERRIVFTSYSGKDRSLRLWDMIDDSIVTTTVQSPLTFKWLSNDEFIAVGHQNNTSHPLIFVYTIAEDSVRYVSPFQLDAHPYIKDAIQISPNLRNVAFIDEAQQHLHLIDCKGLNSR